MPPSLPTFWLSGLEIQTWEKWVEAVLISVCPSQIWLQPQTCFVCSQTFWCGYTPMLLFRWLLWLYCQNLPYCCCFSCRWQSRGRGGRGWDSLTYRQEPALQCPPAPQEETTRSTKHRITYQTCNIHYKIHICEPYSWTDGLFKRRKSFAWF